MNNEQVVNPTSLPRVAGQSGRFFKILCPVFSTPLYIYHGVALALALELIR